MEKHKYQGRTKEDAILQATINLQETENNLLIKELEASKNGLLKSKKVEIEVLEKRDVIKYIKDYFDNDAHNGQETPDCGLECKPVSEN